MKGHPRDDGGNPGATDTADRRLVDLYEISALLTGLEDVVPTFGRVASVMALTLLVRSVTLILNAAGGTRVLMGRREVDAQGLRAAMEHARSSYAYLLRSDLDVADEDVLVFPLPEPGPPQGKAVAEEQRFVFLPLVDNARNLFGAVQIEGVSPTDERDLLFANAVVNLLAVALHRHLVIEAKQAATEAARNRAEEAEKSIRTRFDLARAITASFGEGLIVLDEQRHLTLLNPAAAKLLDWTVEEALGRPIDDVLQIQHADGTPLSPGEGPLVAPANRRGPRRSEGHVFVGRDGTRHPVAYTVTPLRLDGQTLGSVLVFRDILGLVEAERTQRLLSDFTANLVKSLDEREILSRAVCDILPIMADLAFVDEIGENGVIRRVDVAFADEQKQLALSDNVRRLAAPRNWSTAREAVLASGKPYLDKDVDGITTEGLALEAERTEMYRSIGATSAMVLPLVARGRVIGALTLVTAGSRRRYDERDLALGEEIAVRASLAVDNARLYSQAQRATQARNDMLAVVTHDLRGPLTTIGLLTGLLIRELTTADEVGLKRLSAIQRASSQVLGLINDLLDSTSLEAGRFSVQSEPIEVAPIVTEAAEAAGMRATARSVRVEAHVAPDLPRVAADPSRLVQVLTNLLDNAVKFSPKGSAVEVDVRMTGDEVCIAVSDTGPGIPAADLPHIFDRYWKSDRIQSGTGLGLHIVQGIIEALGGRVWVESDLGQGATFYVTLPVAQ